MTKQRKMEDLVEQVRQVAVEIGFKPTRGGQRSMVPVLVAYLHYRGVLPLVISLYDTRRSWTGASLRYFLKNHLPDIWANGTPELETVSNVVSKPSPVSNPPKLDISPLDTRLDTAQLDKELDTPKLDNRKRGKERGASTMNIAGWTIRSDAKGFYRAYRTVKGKTECRYIGKSLETAEQKLGGLSHETND